MSRANGLGERLVRARKAMHFSQETLAERLNVTRQTVSNWEGGKSLPDIEMLKNLSAVLGVPVEKLIYGEEEAVERPYRIPNGVGRLCFGLAIAVYILGFVFSFVFARESGFNDLKDRITDVLLPWWFFTLLAGTPFLALSEILRLLSIRKAQDHSLQ